MLNELFLLLIYQNHTVVIISLGYISLSIDTGSKRRQIFKALIFIFKMTKWN